MTDADDTLPPGWVVAPLEDLLIPLEDGRTLHHGWSPQCEKEPSGSDDEWGVLKTTAIQLGAFLPEHNKKLPKSLPPRPQHEVKEGDLLITCAGPRVRCGIPCLVRSTRPRLMLSGKMYRFRVSDKDIDARYLEKYLLSHSAQTAIEAMKTGGSDSGLNLTHDRFKPLPVPVAPLNEQRRIASKIDELFSRIEEGERALERVQKLVERYRQSVLKAAVTGELTRDWREKNKGKLESGEALLARILKARREAWEKAELDKMKARGVTPANDRWKQKYEEPAPPDTSELPALPVGWVWASAEQVCGFITKGTTPPAESMTPGTGEVPYIKVYNLTFDGTLDFSKDPTYISVQTHRKVLARSLLLPGDVVMNIVGPPLGKVSIVPATLPEWNMNQAVAVFRPFDGCENRFLCWHLLGRAALDWYAKKAKATVGQVNLTLEICRATPIPLPPQSEQREVVQLIDLEMSRLTSLETSIACDRHTATGLRQSVLKSAFSGKLISQDPSDEPASVLLERIATERGDAPAKPKRSPKAKSKALA